MIRSDRRAVWAIRKALKRLGERCDAAIVYYSADRGSWIATSC